MRSPRATVPLVALAVVLGAAGSGCQAVGGGTPDPGPVADDLAAGLASGDLADLPLGGDGSPTTAEVTTAYSGIVEGLVEGLVESAGGARPTVRVTDVEEGEGKATATLAWSWPLAAGEEVWEYETEAPMRLAGDAWQVTWSPSLVAPTLEEGELLRVTEVEAPRGDVLGADGLKIVAPREVVRFGVDRSAVPKAQAVTTARRLAQLAGVTVASYVEQVRAAGEKAFVEAITYRKDDVPPRLAQGYAALPGALAVPDEAPLAPTREFAAPILGTVGPVTAEMIEEEPDRFEVGDEAGLSGLQARYDEQLQGESGLVVNAVSDDPSGGDDERELFRVDPVRGEDLELSLDIDLQLEAERLLADIGPASALVALRPSTGEVLAAANGPGNDGLNLATFGQFAPGSTFKIVSSLALVRAGLAPEATVPCARSVVVDGKRFENYDDYPPSELGRVPLRTAVAHSCNTAFISQRDRLEGTDLFDAAVSLGLGIDHDLGFPAYFGSVEPATTETGAAAALIGQGTVLASPMVMAAVIGSVQAGKVVVPRLVQSVETSPPDGAAPLTGKEAAGLRAMLRAVVTEGSGRALAGLPGPPVIAKTGTAEFGPADRLRTHAWMVAAQGDLAVAAFVEEGASGSRTAGPVLEAFLRAARG